MPKNGEVNKEFGIYKNLCCGAEIVIPEGVTFPDCARHIHLPTEWKNLVKTERFPHVTEIIKKTKADGGSNPAA